MAFVAVLGWAGGAWAGGGSSGSGSGSDSGSGATDSGSGSGSGSAGTDTGTDTGSGSETGCDTDGMCTDPGDSITLVTPMDGQTLMSPVSVMVTSTFSCTCTATCCFEEEPGSVFVIVDGTDQIECDVGMCALSLDLLPGDHVLRAIADFSSNVESTQEIMITVEGDVGTSTGAADDTSGLPATTTGTGTGTGTDTDAAASGGDSGCSCRSTAGTPGRVPVGLAWSAVLLVMVRRKRTRRDAHRR